MNDPSRSSGSSWGNGKHQLTNAYMLFLARLACRLSWKETTEAFRTSWDKVFDAVEHVVTFGLEHRAFGQIDAIGVDEIQYANFSSAQVGAWSARGRVTKIVRPDFPQFQ